MKTETSLRVRVEGSPPHRIMTAHGDVGTCCCSSNRVRPDPRDSASGLVWFKTLGVTVFAGCCGDKASLVVLTVCLYIEFD